MKNNENVYGKDGENDKKKKNTASLDFINVSDLIECSF